MAFAMYSRIPAPRVEWKAENMAYALCFFPLIGAFIGLMWLGWLHLAALLGFGSILTAAVASLIPLVLTGGIHMDGFLDTADALFSRAPREKKLEILKDSRSGAGAVISCAAYLLVSFALWTEAPRAGGALWALLLTPVLSRALSALAVVTFPAAKRDGLLVSFQSAAQKTAVRVTCAVWIALCASLMLWLHPLCGALAALASLMAYLWYYLMARRQFGGTTGDLAGWFVQVCELLALCAVAVCARIGGLV